MRINAIIISVKVFVNITCSQKDPKGPPKDPKDQKGTQKDIINYQNYILIRISGKNKFLGIFQLNVLIFFLNTKKEYISKFYSINNVKFF